MTPEAAEWLANHLNGPNGERHPFGCYWCGGTVMVHENGCPGLQAVRQLSAAAEAS